ncbi:Protein FAR1-RELATED SEQUENCE 5 [Acorus calamus]|uniref:Protein FAR1-RELATED SEQUENCE 5 n=1 Tax=Acorus calamus TaxID=4465 RepID=A0AAV9DZ27_ACOCL|nr:Protein FAR1-RELATED SEQUENCE 5 [Acorus calamus]
MIYSYVDSPGSEGGVAMIEYNVGLEDDATDFCTAFDVSLQVGRTDNHSLISPLPLHEQQNSANPPADTVGHSARQDLFGGDGTVRPPDPYVGMSFDSEEAVKTYYVAYASSIGFAVRISRSRRSKKDETVIMLRFVCSKEGYYNKKDRSLDGKKKRKGPGSIREGCKAMLEVRKNVDDQWVVTKYLNEHNHELGVPSKVRYIATEGDTEIEPFLGMEFESYEAAKTYYYTYASRVGFDARVRQSRRSARDESFVMRRFVCRKEGFHVDEDGNGTGDDGKKKAKKIIEKEGCQAVFEIIRKDYDRWVVTKLVTEHTHPLSPTPPNEVRCIRSQGEMLVIAKSFTDIVKKAVAPNGTMPMLGDSSDESESEFQGHTEESVTRYSDLRGDAIRCAQEGAISVETYKIAKEALQKALTDVLMAKIKQRKLQQQHVQNSLKPQKVLNKKPLPKLTQKKLARRRHAEDEEQEE